VLALVPELRAGLRGLVIRRRLLGLDQRLGEVVPALAVLAFGARPRALVGAAAEFLPGWRLVILVSLGGRLRLAGGLRAALRFPFLRRLGSRLLRGRLRLARGLGAALFLGGLDGGLDGLRVDLELRCHLDDLRRVIERPSTACPRERHLEHEREERALALE